jgi:tartrate/fumarate subfamily iron-sulfur-dependent hydro-lyase alpha chain
MQLRAILAVAPASRGLNSASRTNFVHVQMQRSSVEFRATEHFRTIDAGLPPRSYANPLVYERIAKFPAGIDPAHLGGNSRRRQPGHPRVAGTGKKGTIAESALKIIDQNIQLAKRKSQPICQDTGSILFYVDCPVGFDQITFEETAKEAVKLATKKGFLRQNSVDSLTGKSTTARMSGRARPRFHFHQHRSPELSVRLVLKGGGCENVGAQYSLPNEKLNANRDLDGCRKAILDAVLQAQGKGCGPGILGVCIGGDRATSYEMSKTQFLRLIPDRNPNPAWTSWSRTF